ncbi:class II aldolase/adducin family protein [Ruegeria sp.]|uniref:class II aldolase/adducin family protein n=1 Tax=Ruegeria sp. TaxID=1879320 RepID=UPI002321CD89|nr:class II aldolase/adducin family protein [Ruegeria sp.]MDA7965577.1 class II aldolase/adducin family protein [Ruegeria sp.]
MSVAAQLKPQEMDHWDERVELAAAARLIYKLNLHEGVANHVSLAVSPDGTRFLVNPSPAHFGRLKASDMLLLDANDDGDVADSAEKTNRTALGVHGSVHRHCPHARCVIHVHCMYSTVLGTLMDANLPPIAQSAVNFYNRYVIDTEYGGLSFKSEGERCAAMLSDPKKKVMIMGNHGVMVLGANVADAFNRLYYFERAAETYIRALQTGQPLRYLPHEIAEKTSQQLEDYPDYSKAHLAEMRAFLDDEGADYAS